MGESLFHVTNEASAHFMHFTVPPTIDTMEIDSLIANVLASLEPASSEKWVMDLTQVSYMGSSMLGLMVNIRERIRRSNGKLALCGLSPQLMRVFQTCCLERLFLIAKTREEAVLLLARK
ncbi:MAG: anti-sigma factor antagonist [Planctomycetota bacterium]|nr:anti-sigma factor antagonist [Planctomycetota bacterium]